MKLTASRKAVLFVLPVLLILSTALVFASFSEWFNAELGYVCGFIFYWLVWCLLVPLFVIGTEGIRALFREDTPLFSRSNWVSAGVLVLIVAITLIMYPPTETIAAPTRLLVIAIPVAIINGVCEELLWRGLYVKAFPKNPFLGMVFPAVGFALWHISPQLVFPASSGVWPFVISTFFLGISYGLISYRTGSIRWNVISHSLGGILDLGGAIAPSIVALLFR